MRIAGVERVEGEAPGGDKVSLRESGLGQRLPWGMHANGLR